MAYVYDTATHAQKLGEIQIPEPGRLKGAAERISLAREGIDRFLYRFNGPRAEGGATTEPSPPDHYRNDIENVFRELERLEKTVEALGEIG